MIGQIIASIGIAPLAICGAVWLSATSAHSDKLWCSGIPMESPECVGILAKREAAYQRKLQVCKTRNAAVIGMTKAEAIASKWGRPLRLNNTETVGGTQEQWVYDWPDCIDGFVGLHQGWRGYLYFTNDVLTAIQR